MSAERRLIVREGDQERDVLLVGTVTVGRSALCEISSSDPRLSREHASIQIVGADVVVRDLDSRNGTRVNGAPIGEHRLAAGDTVEVGPFVIRLVGEAQPASGARHAAEIGNEDATVRLPVGPPRSDAAAPALPPRSASASASDDAGEDPEATRIQQRPTPVSAAPAAAAVPVPPAGPAPAHGASAPPAAASASDAPAGSAPAAAAAPSKAAAQPGPGRELSFGATMLLWVMPLALVSLVAGLLPSLLQDDERMPLLEAHYAELATSAAELARVSREPDLPLDGVTTALSRHVGVVKARIVGAEGRVLAPMNEAGTRLDVPALEGTAPRVAILDSGLVDLAVPATTRDGRPVVVTLSVDPSRIRPAPGASPVGILSLLVCLAGAWAVARKVTRITDARLSRLGEELELMTTRQVTVGRDPFGLRGGQRILDAGTFSLSSTLRRPPGSSHHEGPADGQSARLGDAATDAVIEADAGFRVVRADAACETLLGVSPAAVRGTHLVDALRDDVLVNEVLRLVTLATTDLPARGEAAPGGQSYRLRIEVTRRPGPTPLTIRFARL